MSHVPAKRRLDVTDCGIFGIFTYDGWAASEIYEGLLMLQHRGQDSAGIVSFDGHKFREHKARGELLLLSVTQSDSLRVPRAVCSSSRGAHPSGNRTTAS